MWFAKHWSRARVDLRGDERPDGTAAALGWSDVDPAAAHAHALERARRLATFFATRFRGEGRDSLRPVGDYYVGDRPMREPIVESLGSEGDLAGVITRNAYGAYVLNTTRAMFVDIDLPPPAPKPGWWARWWGPPPAPPPDIEGRVRELAAREGLGVRLYRTAAGYRALLTHRPYDPVSGESATLLGRFDSDPLYRRLCSIQRCFRARLSPKPWRLGLPPPQTSYFPWDDDPDREARFRAWDETYRRASERVSVCQIVGTFGPAAIHPALADIVAVHDRWCLGAAPLA